MPNKRTHSPTSQALRAWTLSLLSLSTTVAAQIDFSKPWSLDYGSRKPTNYRDNLKEPKRIDAWLMAAVAHPYSAHGTLTYRKPISVPRDSTLKGKARFLGRHLMGHVSVTLKVTVFGFHPVTGSPISLEWESEHGGSLTIKDQQEEEWQLPKGQYLITVEYRHDLEKMRPGSALDLDLAGKGGLHVEFEELALPRDRRVSKHGLGATTDEEQDATDTIKTGTGKDFATVGIARGHFGSYILLGFDRATERAVIVVLDRHGKLVSYTPAPGFLMGQDMAITPDSRVYIPLTDGIRSFDPITRQFGSPIRYPTGLGYVRALAFRPLGDRRGGIGNAGSLILCNATRALEIAVSDGASLRSLPLPVRSDVRGVAIADEHLVWLAVDRLGHGAVEFADLSTGRSKNLEIPLGKVHELFGGEVRHRQIDDVMTPELTFVMKSSDQGPRKYVSLQTRFRSIVSSGGRVSLRGRLTPGGTVTAALTHCPAEGQQTLLGVGLGPTKPFALPFLTRGSVFALGEPIFWLPAGPVVGGRAEKRLSIPASSSVLRYQLCWQFAVPTGSQFSMSDAGSNAFR